MCGKDVILIHGAWREALMADNVRIKKLQLCVSLSIEDAETLRDALQVNAAVEDLGLGNINVNSFVVLAQGVAMGHNVKKFCVGHGS
jgi:hypothetical protein